MKKIEMMIKDEISKIEERGLNSANIEVLYKMIDMLKDIKTIEGMASYDNETSVHNTPKSSLLEKLESAMMSEGMDQSEALMYINKLGLM